MSQHEDRYTQRNRALAFAARAHRDQYRKGTAELADDLDRFIGIGVPYIMHPAAVGMLLLEHGAGDDAVIAGILHDVIEDTKADRALVEQEFGARVADLVAAESEPDKSRPWRERKQHTIDHLRSTKDLDVKLIAAADKLHNVQSIQLDLATLGEPVWGRFNATKEEQAWYYHSICEALGSTGGDHPLFDLLDQAVAATFGKSVVATQ
jgi:(p)ppGpp synthase/HD superfamily hydrolase